ncbi:MAG: di-heme-cytochrome C peroxidase [Gammaproteobacteria bacterium]|nr:di-heme-cytochrome C peroxidase [Gammaproteobacteria bacterium]MDH5653516.1 di-heme-cytochrome C peroxidase [Gammaproteobacteria bacterium]
MTWQNWDAADSMWYYTTTQGSDLIPYDFFIVLEQKNSKELFRSNKNMDKFRYIPQRKTFHNPDGLPLGLAKDTYKGKDYMGFTCAACHTNQINYNGVAIRVDGAQTLADMENFVIELSQSLNATLNDKEKKERFIDAVMDRNGFFKIFTGSRNYSSRKAVEEDLIIYASRVQDYTYINQSKYVDKDNKKKHLQYGYGRLDAFGRIFNRTRQHVLNTDSVNAGLDSMVKNGIITPAQANKLRVRTEGIITDKVFDNISMTAKEMVKKRELKPEQMRALIDTFFQSPNAPVSYPFVWDTPQHDFVQWNGLLDNAGPGPLGRNTGEVIGVFGTLDWREKKGKLTNPSYLIAKALGSTNGEWFVNFESSVDQTNLVRLEHHIADLWSPWWQDLADAGVFPKIDQASAARGDKLFDKHCVSCHHDINRSEKDRRVVAFMTNLEVSGTDRVMAENALQYAGYTGITRNQYMSTDVGNILMQEKMPVAAMLFIATSNVVATPDPDKWVFRRWADLVYNFISTMDDNPVGSSIKAGNYSPDTTASPFESLKAYKARPLNGIWATAPYLHNGSIPNLYELLLPPAERKKTFHIGSREFDPVNVGFVSEPGRGFEFDTTKPGNSNAGHDYKNKSLNKQDRMDLIEYMKTL